MQMLETDGSTLEDLESNLKDKNEWAFDSTEDLKNMLDGMVIMKKLQKVGNLYAGLGVEIKQRRQSNSDRHVNSDENIDYPDWVTTEKDKIQYLLSPECPPLNRAKTTTYFDDQFNTTGREIHDVLTSYSIVNEVCVAPDNAKGCNYIVYHNKSRTARGFGINVKDGKYRLHLSHIDKPIEKFFDDYKEMREWILKNL